MGVDSGGLFKVFGLIWQATRFLFSFIALVASTFRSLVIYQANRKVAGIGIGRADGRKVIRKSFPQHQPAFANEMVSNTTCGRPETHPMSPHAWRQGS